MDPDDCHIGEKCSRFSGFTVYKAWFVGIWTLCKCSLEIDNTMIAESAVGFFPYTMGPNAVEFKYAHNYHKITNSLIMGHTPAFDCMEDPPPEDDDNILGSYKAKPWYTDEENSLGFTGVGWPNFASDKTKYPEKRWIQMKIPPAILGIMTIEGSNFISSNYSVPGQFLHFKFLKRFLYYCYIISQMCIIDHLKHVQVI